jgi:hypothetical protein
MISLTNGRFDDERSRLALSVKSDNVKSVFAQYPGD